MKKIRFFPYHPDTETIIRYEKYLSCEYQVAEFTSFREDEEIINFLNNKLHNYSSQYDILILLDDYRDCLLDKYYEVMDTAIADNAEVFIVPDMIQRLDLTQYEGKYQLLDSQPNLEAGKNFQLENKKMYTADVPIITVLGQGRNSGKFETQLLLKNIIEEMGYTVTVVSSNPLAALYDCYTIPHFFFDDTYNYENKIIQFNHYLYMLSRIEKPDIIVLGIPGGTSRFAKSEYNQFGLFPLMATSAVTSDLSVLCTYYNTPVSDEVLGAFQEKLKGRFGINLNAVSICDTAYEYGIGVSQDLEFRYLNREYIKRHPHSVNDMSSQAFFLRGTPDNAKKVVTNLINTLIDNLELV